MTADWTTCRVVRDRDGGLWSRDRDAGWMNRWRDYYGADIWLDEDRGPLVPVLDADGLPVVATVGDPDEDERIAAWEAIAEHPIFAPCYDTAAPLLRSMLDRLDGLAAQPDPAATASAALAWDAGADFVTRHPGMSAEYVRAANPYRQPEGNRA